MRSSDPGARRPWSRARGRAYASLTALLLLGLAAGLAELGLRLRWTPSSCASDPSLRSHPHFEMAPLPWASGNLVSAEYSARFEHTGRGWRNDLDPGRPRRILVLGDSQTYGLGVSNGETFVDRIESAHAELDLWNAGCNGYGTRNHLATLCAIGRAWRPELVALVFFWNDVEDNLKDSVPQFARSSSGRPEPLAAGGAEFDLSGTDPPAAGPRGTPRPCRKRSYLVAFLKEGLRGLRYRWIGMGRRAIRTAADAEAGWAETRALLELVQAECEALGAKLLVAALPDHNQVDPRSKIRNIEPLNFVVQARLAEELDRLGIEHVDLLPELRAAFEAGGPALYYYADRHLTARGHGVVAEALGPRLVSELEE